MSYTDRIFIQNCGDTLDRGVWDADYQVRPVQEDGALAHTIKRFGTVNRHDLSDEFPVITLRRTAFKSTVDELLWIRQKRSNNTHDLNSHIQDSWADGNDFIGRAYGYRLGVKHRYKEGDFDQVGYIFYDLKHSPLGKRITSNTCNHYDLHEMNLYLYAYSMTSNVSGHTLDGILSRRSQDILTASSWNVCQYAVPLHISTQVSGFRAGELVHVIADAHTYDQHVPMVEGLLKREPYSGPTLTVDISIIDFYQFTTSSFHLEDYQYHTFESKIPVVI